MRSPEQRLLAATATAAPAPAPSQRSAASPVSAASSKRLDPGQRGDVADRRRGRVAARPSSRAMSSGVRAIRRGDRLVRAATRRRSTARASASVKLVVGCGRWQDAGRGAAEPGERRDVAQRAVSESGASPPARVAAKLDDQIGRLVGDPPPDVAAFRLLGVLVEALDRRERETVARERGRRGPPSAAPTRPSDPESRFGRIALRSIARRRARPAAALLVAVEAADDHEAELRRGGIERRRVLDRQQRRLARA